MALLFSRLPGHLRKEFAEPMSAIVKARPGHTEGGFTSGLLHPMLAMAAIGFWSVRQRKLMKNATLAFVFGGMVLGAALARRVLSLPGVETGISFLVLVAEDYCII